MLREARWREAGIPFDRLSLSVKTTVTTSITIDRPPRDVADTLLDADKAVLWTTDLRRFEVVARPPGLVGSRARLHYKQGEREYVMEDELLAFEPDRRFLSRVTGDAIEADVETLLSPTNGGTHVQVTWSGSGKHPILRLLLPFMRRSIARQAQADLLKLKALIESDQRSEPERAG
jgi:uncharacterized protein YndB with AHSA1/START domain